jgi:hypothetical protein
VVVFVGACVDDWVSGREKRVCAKESESAFIGRWTEVDEDKGVTTHTHTHTHTHSQACVSTILEAR